MKKAKQEKGITLIALIITIIVLLILAVVTIGAVQDSKIITYAQNAADDYNEEKGKEESIISGYESLIEQYTIPGNEEAAPPKDKPEETGSVAYYISNDSGMEIIQKLDNENLLCTTYFKETNGEYFKKADTQIEAGEAIVESITINAYNYATNTAYSENLQPGTIVYYINVDGEKVAGIYVTDNEIYGLSEYGYAIFQLITDESKISDIETGISNIVKAE